MVAGWIVASLLWLAGPGTAISQQVSTTIQIEPQHQQSVDETLREAEHLQDKRRKLDRELESLVSRVQPGTPEARQVSDGLITRARILLLLNDRQAARRDAELALNLVPDDPGALDLLDELQGVEGDADPESDWPIEWYGPAGLPEEEVGDKKSQASLNGPLLALFAGVPRYWSLPAAWVILWSLLHAQGVRTTREVDGSRIRLMTVSAALASFCLLPAIACELLGILNDPHIEQLFILVMGTFSSVIFCFQFLQPPIRIQGQQSLPLVDSPDFLDRVARLAEAVGVKSPPVRLWPSTTDSQMALAFAGSLSAPQLVVTDGILNRLETEETDAILAHELGHLANHTLWFLAPQMSIAATAACVISDWGVWPAAALGTLVFVGLQRITSRPLEFDCDRRAALAVNPQAMMRALEKIHVLHSIRGETWLRELCHATSTHPSLDCRNASLKRIAGLPLSAMEAVSTRRGERLGWLAIGVWLAAIIGGLWTLHGWPASANVVSVVWIVLSQVPMLLILRGTRKERQLHARRLVPTRRSRSTWIFAACFGLCVAGIFLPMEYFAENPIAPLISVVSVCLLFVTVGFALWRMASRSRLQHKILTAFTLGHYEDVVYAFDSAPRWFRQNPIFENTTAIALALVNRRAEALQRLEQLEQREPRFPAGLMTLIALDHDAGNDRRAEILAARLTEVLPEDPIGPFRQVFSLVHLGRLNEAREVLTTARSRIATAPLLDLAEAAVAIADNQPAKARELLEVCDRHLPGDGHLAVLWVEWALQQGDTAHAHTLLQRLETLAQSNRLAFLDNTVSRLRRQLEQQKGAIPQENPAATDSPSQVNSSPVGSPPDDNT